MIVVPLRSALRTVGLAALALALGATPLLAQQKTRTTPTPDPRVGLAAGKHDAGEAIWNLRMLSTTPSPGPFAANSNTDLAFKGDMVFQGNYNGFMVWNIKDPARPYLMNWAHCPASQSDVSVYGNLLFVSAEGLTGRLDCGTQGVPAPVSDERVRGIRIFDITDVMNPVYVGNVQTCRGSHTHTVVTDAKDPDHVYVYISGSGPVRSPDELPGCSSRAPGEDPNSSLFRIEVIKVPLKDPSKAAIVGGARFLDDLAPAPQRGQPMPQRARSGPSQCHDITVYPAVGLAGGACGGYGVLLDISDPANPRRLDAVADTNFSFWHSATFSNDGSMVLFTDEWGGGRAPRCRDTDKYEWGANAIFRIVDGKMRFQSYYKMPAVQTEWENCVAHNGSPIPIPGREVMVQGWYQGGISIFDWTDPTNPMEIAFHDRGPLRAGELTSAGSWSVYWYNGVIVNSEIARGLDVLELVPSTYLSQNEIDAAKTVVWEQLNPQEQPRMVWPASFAKARAFADQLERSKGLAPARLAAVRTALAGAERMTGAARRDALGRLANQLDADARGSADAGKVTNLASAVRELIG